MKYIFATLLMISGAVMTTGQNTAELDSTGYIADRVYLVEPSIKVLFPQGNFSRQLDETAVLGLSVAMFMQLQPGQPAFVGLDLGYSEVARYSLFYTGFFPNGDPAEYDAVATSSMVDLSLGGRYYPGVAYKSLELYVDANFGMRWMYTSQRITSFFMGIEEASDFDIDQGDVSLLYGAGLGAQLSLNHNFYINTKLSYMGSGSMEYTSLPEGGPVGGFGEPLDAFVDRQSATTALRWDIGITYAF